MTEIRTTSSTGGQKGVKPQRYDLLPKTGLDAISEVFAFGATKYADHNWRKGYEWSKSYAAAMRHMTAFWDGETNDPESGLPHLSHAGFHILAMLTWLADQGEGGEFDDRWINSPALADVLEKNRKTQDILDLSAMQAEIEGGGDNSIRMRSSAFVHPDEKVTSVSMPSEMVKKLSAVGYTADEARAVREQAQFHFNGSPGFLQHNLGD